MTQIFKQYADYYDALYQKKDYPGECDYLIELWNKFSDIEVKSILDLGCGTGNHSHIFAEKNYDVLGIDQSVEMLNQARNKMQHLSNPANLLVADLCNFNLKQTFDSLISMFAVVGYLTTNSQLSSLFTSVYDHLKPGGLFVFDVWYGPAVLNQLPENRDLTIETKQQKFRRQAIPSIDYAKDVVQIDYTLLTLDSNIISSEFHRMRYFFIPELELLAAFHNLSIEAVFSFFSFDEPCESDWNVTVVLKKRNNS